MMNLLVSDRVLIDPMFEDSARWQDNLGEYAFSVDLVHDRYEYEAADLASTIGTLRL
jgi:hypothetical protein